MSRTRYLLLLAVVLTLQAGLIHSLSAQDDEEEEAAPSTPSGPPTKAGGREVVAAVGQAGMTFELHNKARLFVPPDLPIGSARRMRFAESTDRFAPSEVHGAMPGSTFTRVGPVLTFDGAINATSAPVIVSIHQPRDPSRAGQHLVLAMEQATICAEGMSHVPGSTSLCSGWEIIPATWASSRVSAELRTPGGFRLVFGNLSIPETEEGDEGD